MTLDDAEHYSDKQRADIISQYPEHMRDIRAKGMPSFGAGLIFPVDEKTLLVDPFTVRLILSGSAAAISGGHTKSPLASCGTTATLTLFI